MGDTAGDVKVLCVGVEKFEGNEASNGAEKGSLLNTGVVLEVGEETFGVINSDLEGIGFIAAPEDCELPFEKEEKSAHPSLFEGEG